MLPGTSVPKMGNVVIHSLFKNGPLIVTTIIKNSLFHTDKHFVSNFQFIPVIIITSYNIKYYELRFEE